MKKARRGAMKKALRGGAVDVPAWSTKGLPALDTEFAGNNKIDLSGDGQRKKMVYTLEGVPGGLCFQEPTPSATPDAARDRPTERSVLQQLGDATTSAFVNDMFQDHDKLNQYLALFVHCVNQRTSAYLEENVLTNTAYLVYKGGNVLADHFEKFVKLPSASSSIVIASLQSLVARSDADFQFYFSNKEAWENHNDAIKRLIIAALYDFMSELQQTTMVPTSVDQINNKVYDDIFAKNKNGYTITTESKEITKRVDFMVLNNPKRPDGMLKTIMPILDCSFYVVQIDSLVQPVADFTARPKGAYVTYNDTLRFGDADIRIAFDLIRLKLNVNLQVTMSKAGEKVEKATYHAPSELIDVSISTPEDYKIQGSTKDIAQWTQEYPVTLRSKNNAIVKLRIPNLDYMVNDDLYRILFTESKGFPWADQKYEKRIRRYIVGNVLLCMQLYDKGFTHDGADTDTAATQNSWCTVVTKINALLYKLFFKVHELQNLLVGDTYSTFDDPLLNEAGFKAKGYEFNPVQDEESYTIFSKMYQNIMSSIKQINQVMLNKISSTGQGLATDYNSYKFMNNVKVIIRDLINHVNKGACTTHIAKLDAYIDPKRDFLDVIRSPEESPTSVLDPRGGGSKSIYAKGVAKAGASKGGLAKPNSAKAGAAKPNSAKAGAAKPNSAKAGAAKPNSAKAGAAKPNSAKAGAAKPNSAKAGAAKPNSAKAGSPPPPQPRKKSAR